MSITVDRWTERNPPNPEQLRHHLIVEGYRVFRWSDAAGTRYANHAHAEHQSHWIISGELELHVNGETYTLRAGDRDFLPANTIHSAYVPGDQPVVYLIGAKD